jgi:hypothetical protein
LGRTKRVTVGRKFTSTIFQTFPRSYQQHLDALSKMALYVSKLVLMQMMAQQRGIPVSTPSLTLCAVFVPISLSSVFTSCLYRATGGLITTFIT